MELKQVPGDSPVLSVVLVLGDKRDRAVDCLRSLIQQNTLDRLEVLLID